MDIETICCSIISTAGTAKSMYIEAIYMAKKGQFDQAREHIQQAEQYSKQANEIHFDLLQKEASGQDIPFKLLIAHTESILMSSQEMKITSEELIDVYERLEKLEEKK